MSFSWAPFEQAIKQRPGTRLTQGLTRSELADVQQILGFVWPPDLCDVLSAGMPMGPDWPNWRRLARAGSLKSHDADVRYINDRLNWPLKGMLFDIERNSFWDPHWGERPANLADAKDIATKALRAAPPLIPVYIHRYLPALPCEPGNPVLSVHQMDIIIYGTDLPTYLANEFLGRELGASLGKEIPNWTGWMQIGR